MTIIIGFSSFYSPVMKKEKNQAKSRLEHTDNLLCGFTRLWRIVYFNLCAIIEPASLRLTF
jgi:hypothetical protein